MIDPALFINESICDLEDILFKDRYFAVSVFAGAAGAISDDLIDNANLDSYSQIALLIPELERPVPNSDRTGLLHAFNSGLINLLPAHFIEKSNYVIRGYNKAQIDSLRLSNPKIKNAEIIDIKNRAGGYSVLFLYSLLFPKRVSTLNGVDEKYDPSERFNPSKNKAFYDYGAWSSRIDDLWDEVKDRARKMKQLATEGCITWNSIKKESKYVFEGLALYYPRRRVTKVFANYFAPLIEESITKRYNL